MLPCAGLPASFSQDFLAHRRALRSQAFSLPISGDRKVRWAAAQAWERWYSLLTASPSGDEPVALLGAAADQILTLAPESHRTWAAAASSPEAVWHHPLAEALVRFNDGNGVAPEWLLPLMDAASACATAQLWATFVGESVSYSVPVQSFAALGVLERSPVRIDLSAYQLASELEAADVPWAWCKQVAQEIPELVDRPEFWSNHPNAALDAVLLSGFKSSRWPIQAVLMTFLCEAGARPSMPAFQSFLSDLGNSGGAQINLPALDTLKTWVGPLEVRANARRLETGLPKSPPPPSAPRPRF